MYVTQIFFPIFDFMVLLHALEFEGSVYGVENEMYTCKVVGCLRSNSYVDVPVYSPEVEKLHPEVVDVVACITCGIIEKDVLNYRISDVKGE